MTIEIPLDVMAIVIGTLANLHEGLEIGGLVVVEEDAVEREKIQAILMEDIALALNSLRPPMEKKVAALVFSELTSILPFPLQSLNPKAEA